MGEGYGYSAADDSSQHIRAAVMLPPDECFEEWVAMHCLEFFEDVCEIYSLALPHCNKSSCTDRDSVCQSHLRWVEEKLNDANLFPTKLSNAFPRRFRGTLRAIFKRMSRVYASIFCLERSTLQQIKGYQEGKLELKLKHFVLFVSEHDLIPASDPVLELLRSKFCAGL